MKTYGRILLVNTYILLLVAAVFYFSDRMDLNSPLGIGGAILLGAAGGINLGISNVLRKSDRA